MKTPASEVIRTTALTLLAQHPQGKSLADLRFLTQNVLKQVIEPDNQKNGKYRSALWDLEKRYPKYVLKENEGRAAIFIPTEKLQNEKGLIEVPVYSPSVKELLTKSSSSPSKNYKNYVEIKAKIIDVLQLIENIDLKNFDIRDFRDYTEAADIMKAIIHLEGLQTLKYSLQMVKSEDEYHK